MQQKLKLLVRPYLIICASFIGIYSFIYWGLFTQLHIDSIDEDLVKFWIPYFLPWVPVLIWLRPKIKLLKLNRSGTRSPGFLFMFIATAGCIAPTIIATSYIESATGKLTELSNINEIGNHELTKYYSIKNYFPHKAQKSVEYSSEVSGKYNQDFNLYIHIVCPVYYKVDNTRTKISELNSGSNRYHDSITAGSGKPILNKNDNAYLVILDGKPIAKDELNRISPDSVANISVLKGKAAEAMYGDDGAKGVLIVTTKREVQHNNQRREMPPAWLGIRYYKKISNRLGDDSKRDIEHAFYNECMQNFEDSNLNSFSYFDRIANTKDRRRFKEAIEKTFPESEVGNVIIFTPENGNFKDRNGNKLAWIFGSFAIAFAVWFIAISIPKIDEKKIRAAPQKNTTKEIRAALKYFIPSGDFFVTPILIDVNIIIFMLLVFSGNGFLSFTIPELLNWGANYKPLTTNGEWWRLFSSIFLHGGFVHLLSNMIALLFAGLLLEPLTGRKIFTIIYCISGLAASAISLWWNDTVVSVGASGAIFGLYGVLLILLLSKMVSPSLSKLFLISIIFFIAYNLSVGLLGQGIDNAAHIGGLLAGILLGFLTLPSIKKRSEDDQSI